jgi:glycogen(starch) synthase
MTLNDKRLRILQLIYDHPDNPWCGGGGAGRTWAINHVLSRQHDITVFCGGFPGAKHRGEPFDVRFFRSANSYIGSRIKFMSGCLKMDTSPYDLVVEEFSYYAPVFRRFSARPLVTVLQGRHGFRAIQYRGVYGLISLISEYVVLKMRRSVVIVSEHLRSAVHRKAYVKAIAQGANIPEDFPPGSEEYVLYLGRLDIWHKGLDILIEAWRRLKESDKSLSLVIAGGGDSVKVKKLINKKGAKNISLSGRLTHDEALTAINRAAFLCIPSRMEGSPLVLYEAFRIGKPVIGTSIPALRDLIPHDVAGLQVPPENPVALSEAINSLLNDGVRRKRLAEGARKLGQKFRWDVVAKEQEGFYFDVIKRWEEEHRS